MACTCNKIIDPTPLKKAIWEHLTMNKDEVELEVDIIPDSFDWEFHGQSGTEMFVHINLLSATWGELNLMQWFDHDDILNTFGHAD